MALQQIPGIGAGFWYPHYLNIPPVFLNSTAIATSTDKHAVCGRVWTPTRGSKNISRVGFRFGSAITKAGGSGLTLSLQDVSLIAGVPMQPDEVQDQTVAIANGDATFAANTWHRSGALSATRTVSPDDLLAVVVEYDGGGRLGADSVTFSCLDNLAASPGANFGQFTDGVKTTGTWQTPTRSQPIVALEFDDGTFGGLMRGRSQ